MIWTIPTFIFTLPFLYLASIFIFGKKYFKKLILSGVFILIGSFIVYLPILDQLIGASKFGWGFNGSLRLFLNDSFKSISNFSYINNGILISILFLVTFFFSLSRIRNNITSKELKIFVLFLFSSIISYFLTIIFAVNLNLITIPFLTSSSIRVFRTATKANSEATKKPFKNTRRIIKAI
jgi:hypothetical protein